MKFRQKAPDLEEKIMLKERKQGCRCSIPARYVISIMCSFGIMMTYCQRTCLSQAIVSMVNHSAIAVSDAAIIPCVYIADTGNFTNSTDSIEDGSLVWDEETQGIILSCFYWGYLIAQLPGGWISNKMGGKWPMGLGLLVGALMMFVLPIAAVFDWRLFVVLRVIQGCGNGVVFTSCMTLLAKWVPSNEKSILISFALSGAILGTMLNFPISGFLTKFAGGWPSIFYGFGCLTVVWFSFWVFLVYDSPDVHPRITLEEKTYLEITVGKTKAKVQRDIPWKAIALSKPVWAVCLCHFLMSYGFYTLLSDLPSYISNILGFPILQNSNLMMLPYLLFYILYLISSYAGDRLQNKGLLAPVYIRKGSFSISVITTGSCLAAVTYVGCNRIAALALLFVAIGALGINAVGEALNFADIAPEFAGIITAVQNLFATSAAIVAPAVVGIVTQKQNTSQQWNKVFLIASALYGVSLFVFNIMGSAEVQKWNYVDESTTTDTEEPSVITKQNSPQHLNESRTTIN